MFCYIDFSIVCQLILILIGNAMKHYELLFKIVDMIILNMLTEITIFVKNI